MVRKLIAASVVAAAVLWTYLPARSFAFLNWDDHAVILQNPELRSPNVPGWAFTTIYMEHYQPLSWLTWAAIERRFGADATAFHTANIVLHVICVLLLGAVSRAILARTLPHASDRARDAGALAAAVLFGLHPLRVEVVAWISALPYALALVLLLSSVLAYLRASSGGSRRWRAAALALYVASLLARPVALGYPVVLVVLDVWIFRRRPRESVARAWPFALVAVAAAVVESVARASGAYGGSWLFRLQSAVTAPFAYLWRFLAPVALTPLDALPLHPAVNIGALFAGTLALVALSFAAWRWRRRWPGAAAGWAAYLALLAPAAGLLPSGLQLTADRYTYLPGAVIAMVTGAACAYWSRREASRARLVAAASLAIALAAALATRSVLRPWSDSVSLWTHVITLNPQHDIGLYNLATALAAEGRSDEAARRYRELLALQPEHSSARANLDRLDAARFEQEGNALAAKGDLAGAVERYGQAIALDGQRTHSRASRGMALASLGRGAEAISELREAVRQGADAAEVSNALGVLLLQSGEPREAREVLQRALAIHQDDVNLAHNLARLLATSSDSGTAEAALSLELAVAVVERTGGRDPRALDTMAAALAANGRLAEAGSMSARAAAVAESQGDRALAEEIKARGRAYRR